MLSRPGARDGGPHQAPGPAPSDVAAPTKPVVLSAVISAGACLLTGLLTCAAVAVIGWLAATFGGASGAIRAGAAAWLVAHKAGVTLGSGAITIAPLGLTLFLGWCLYRGGKSAARTSAADRTKDLILLVGTFTLVYALGALIIALLTADGSLKVSPLSAFFGAASLALVAGTIGVLVESGAAADIADATPPGLRDAVPAAAAAVLTVIAIASLLYGVLLAIRFSRVTGMLELLNAGVVGSVVLFAICLMLIPNMVLYVVAFLAGPGFQLGVGTTIAPTGVDVGNLPALPLLAAVPADGATPTYLLVLTAVVPLAAGVIAGLVVARRGLAEEDAEALGWDAFALRGGMAALVAGLMLYVLMALSGGSAGPGRMSAVGIPAALPAAGVLAAGMAIGASITAALIASRRPADVEADAGR
ncbi:MULTISPECIES: cell division protein PerM [unclassified Kribbella]|uniref:cell division protein PerM n=1 Tax=unclassified Kribbella TaxID=2644121 RepID=UPI003017C31E